MTTNFGWADPFAHLMAGAGSIVASYTASIVEEMDLPVDHPTAVVFLDESGAIAQDRFFAVGCLKLAEPSVLLRGVQKLRDRNHWYREIHFAELTRDALPFYRQVVSLLASSDCEFSCFVADRHAADPLQVADLLTAAVAFEFRQSAGLAGADSPKARLARHVRESYGVESFLGGCDAPPLGVRLYRDPT